MASVIKDLETTLKGELKAADLNDLKAAFNTFIKGTPGEEAVAEAIARNVQSALAAYVAGEISKSDLEFVLEHSKKATIGLAEAKAVRIKKAALRVFFNVVIKALKFL